MGRETAAIRQSPTELPVRVIDREEPGGSSVRHSTVFERLQSTGSQQICVHQVLFITVVGVLSSKLLFDMLMYVVRQCPKFQSCQRLLDGEELDVEEQSRVLGDSRNLLVAVGEVGGDRQLSLSTNGHAGETLVPALDDLSSAKDEREGGTASVGVELLATLELADVSGLSMMPT